MKPALNKSLTKYLASISAALLTACPAALADDAFHGDAQVIDTDVSGGSVTIQAPVSEEDQGVVMVTSGNEHRITATEGDIRIENTDMEATKTGAVMLMEEGARLIVSTAAAGSGSIYLTGRNAVKVGAQGYAEFNAGNTGTIYADGAMGVNADGESATIIFNGSLKATSTTNNAINMNRSLITISRDCDVTTTGARGISMGNSASFTASGKSTVRSQQGGVRAANMSTATFGSNLTINNETEHSLAALGGSTVTVQGYTTINSNETASNYYGVLSILTGNEGSAKSTVELNGASVTTQRGVYAVGATEGGIVKGNTGTYRLTTGMRAWKAGQITMNMTGGSYINGITTMDSGQGSSIDLAMSGDSLWQVTGTSQLTSLTLGQGSALQFAFNGASLTDIITATDTITLESGSYIYLTGDLSSLKDDNTFDFFSGTLVNNGVKFVGFDGADWVEYEYTQTGANTFRFSGITQTLADEPAFIEAIPEPATATLGLLGLASLLARRRKA